MPCLSAELASALASRDAEGLTRRRRVMQSAQGARVVVDGREMLHFGSNDYLGLANDPGVVAAAQRGAARFGVGAGASHLVSGHSEAHETLERELAAWVAPHSAFSALFFSTGYLANLGAVTALMGRGDAIFADKLNHASLNDAALLSRAQFVRYRHADMSALEGRLAACRVRRKLIITDAVFSMDGDIASLATILDLAETYDALVLVDDAHGFGVLGGGRGTLAELGLHSERIVYVGTLGKAAGVAGAFVCASRVVIETILQTARSYIFTTASPAMLASALSTALGIVRKDHERRDRLAMLIARWRVASATLPWPTLPSQTPIQPLIVGSNQEALRVSDALWDAGIWVPAIRPPTVPAGSARLRITLSASHTPADIDNLSARLSALAA